MNKQQAIEAMRNGKKVTHPTFTDEEWIAFEGNKIKTEEGYLFNPLDFWMYRQNDAFNKDWSVLQHFLIRVKSKHDCWITEGDGDPPRTLIKENARVYKDKDHAEIQCKNYCEKYPNRHFSIEPI